VSELALNRVIQVMRSAEPDENIRIPENLGFIHMERALYICQMIAYLVFISINSALILACHRQFGAVPMKHSPRCIGFRRHGMSGSNPTVASAFCHHGTRPAFSDRRERLSALRSVVPPIATLFL